MYEMMRPTMEERELEFGKLLLRHGNPHLAVAVLEVLASPLGDLLLAGTLDKGFESGSDSPVNESMQSFVNSTSDGCACDCACSRRSGTE